MNEKTQIMKNFSFYDYMIQIIAIVSIIGAFFFRPMVLVGLVIELYLVVKKPMYYSFFILFFTYSFAEIFKISAGTLSLFTLIELAIVIKRFMVTPAINKKYATSVLMFFCYLLLSCCISGNIGILVLVKMFMGMTLLFLFIEGYKEEYLSDYVWAYIVGIIMTSLTGWIKNSLPGFAAFTAEADTVYFNGIKNYRFSGAFSDTNYYALAIIVGLGLLMCLYCSKGFSLKNIVCAGIIFVFGCLTYSKSYFLMVAVLAFVLLVLLYMKKKIGVTLFLGVIVSIVIASGVLNSINAFQIIMSRFSGVSDIGSITTGRSTIWDTYLEFIRSHTGVLLFGNGVGAAYVNGRAAHNMYIEAVYYVGIIGVLLFAISIMIIYSYKSLTNKKHFVNYYLLVSILVMYFFLCGFQNFEFPLYLMLAWMVVNTELIRPLDRG